MGREVFSHSQKSRAPSLLSVTWEDKHHHLKHPHLSPSSSTLYAEDSTIWHGQSLWPLEVNCLGWVLSQLLVQAPLWQGEVRGRECLDSVQVLLGRS